MKWTIQRKIDINCDREIKELARKSNLSEKTIKRILYHCCCRNDPSCYSLDRDELELLAGDDEEKLYEVRVIATRTYYSDNLICEGREITFCFSNLVYGWPEPFTFTFTLKEHEMEK